MYNTNIPPPPPQPPQSAYQYYSYGYRKPNQQQNTYYSSQPYNGFTNRVVDQSGYSHIRSGYQSTFATNNNGSSIYNTNIHEPILNSNKDSQYALYNNNGKESSCWQNFKNKRPAVKYTIIGLLVILLLIIIGVPLGLMPLYLPKGSSETHEYTIRVENALKSNDTSVNRIIRLPVSDRSVADNESLQKFTQDLDNELNVKIRKRLSEDIKEIKNVSLSPSPKSESEFDISLNLNTFPIVHSKASSLRATLTVLLQNGTIISDIMNSTTILVSATSSALVVGEPQIVHVLSEMPTTTEKMITNLATISKTTSEDTTLSTEETTSEDTIGTTSEDTSTSISTSTSTTSTSTTTATTTTTEIITTEMVDFIEQRTRNITRLLVLNTPSPNTESVSTEPQITSSSSTVTVLKPSPLPLPLPPQQRPSQPRPLMQRPPFSMIRPFSRPNLEQDDEQFNGPFRPMSMGNRPIPMGNRPNMFNGPFNQQIPFLNQPREFSHPQQVQLEQPQQQPQLEQPQQKPQFEQPQQQPQSQPQPQLLSNQGNDDGLGIVPV